MKERDAEHRANHKLSERARIAAAVRELQQDPAAEGGQAAHANAPLAANAQGRLLAADMCAT